MTTMSNSARRSIALAAILLIPLTAHPQTTLTGAMWMATTSMGATSVAQAYADGAMNTLGGDQWWDLWLALNPDATSPVNGPADAQAGISIPLQPGNSYKYYLFGQGPCCNLRFSGLNLFFDGNSSNPGISVFGPVNGSGFRPDNSGTLSLEGNPTPGSGSAFYSSAGFVVVLTGFDWNASTNPPGNVCQEFAFTPAAGDILSAYGSFTLQVYPAAALGLSQTSGSPGTQLAITGSGFGATETVNTYIGQIGSSAMLTATTDANGSFTITPREPQLAYGPVDLYALGASSGKLGAATLSVTAALATNPGTGAPGGTTSAYVFGFGAGEAVDVY